MRNLQRLTFVVFLLLSAATQAANISITILGEVTRNHGSSDVEAGDRLAIHFLLDGDAIVDDADGRDDIGTHYFEGQQILSGDVTIGTETLGLEVFELNVFYDLDPDSYLLTEAHAVTHEKTPGDLNLFWVVLRGEAPFPPSTDFFDVLVSLDSFTVNGRDIDGDVTSVTYANVSEVPLPAAAWLCASGLLGLGVLSQRRNRSA